MASMYTSASITPIERVSMQRTISTRQERNQYVEGLTELPSQSNGTRSNPNHGQMPHFDVVREDVLAARKTFNIGTNE